MLISRKSAQWICGFGMIQLLFAIGLAVCGFIVLGMFHNTSCIGLWLGLLVSISILVSQPFGCTVERACCWCIKNQYGSPVPVIL